MEPFLIVIWGFMGPLILGGIIGIFWALHHNRKINKAEALEAQAKLA